MTALSETFKARESRDQINDLERDRLRPIRPEGVNHAIKQRVRP